MRSCDNIHTKKLIKIKNNDDEMINKDIKLKDNEYEKERQRNE